MNLIKLFPVLFISALLFACSDIDSIKEIVQEKTSSKEPENLDLETDFELVTIFDDYSILIPSYLKTTTILNEDASLQYQNIIKDVYFMVINEPKDEFVDAFKLYDMYDDSLNVAQNLRDAQIENIKMNFEIEDVLFEKSTRIGGMDAELISISGTIYDEESSFDLAYSMAFIDGKEEIYTIYAWCRKNQFKKYQNTFAKSISTFKELK